MNNVEYLIILILATFFLKLFCKNKSKIGVLFHVLDFPTKNKIHDKATPLIGSFPIFIFSVILLIYFKLIFNIQEIIPIFAYSYLFFIMGYIDDRYGLNAYLKLFVSIIIALAATYHLENLTISKIYIETIDKIIIIDKIKIFFSILCVLLLINSLNLIDGINGLASGIASLWLFALSLIVNNEIIFSFLLILSIFMIINTFHIINGKYFLGDSGTLFLGSLVAFLTIYIYNNQLSNNELIAVEKIFIFFMIPGIDMFRLFLTRIAKKKDPFSRDLNHLHHIMLNKFSLNKTLTIYLLLFFATNLFSYFDIINSLIIIIMYLAFYIFFVFFHKKKFNHTS